MIQLCLTKFIPESPVFLNDQSKLKELEKTIKYLFRGQFEKQDLDLKEEKIEDRIQRLHMKIKTHDNYESKQPNTVTVSSTSCASNEIHADNSKSSKFEQKFSKSKLYQIWSDRNLLKPIIYSCLLTLASTLSGLELIAITMTNVIKHAFNFERELSQVLALGISVLRGGFTVVGAIISHSINRRTILLVSVSGIFICHSIIFALNMIRVKFEDQAADNSEINNSDSSSTTSLFGILQLIFITLAYSLFDAGMGTMIWATAVEIMEPSYKNIEQQITMTFHFIMWGIFGYLFTFMMEQLKEYMFLVFVVTNFVYLIYFWFRGVETRNIASHEIAQHFSKQASLF